MERTFSISQLEKEKELLEENIKESRLGNFKKVTKEDAKNWFKEKLK